MKIGNGQVTIHDLTEQWTRNALETLANIGATAERASKLDGLTPDKRLEFEHIAKRAEEARTIVACIFKP